MDMDITETIGFTFETSNDSAHEISDWHMAIKQYMFWVTQNWEEGALLR